MTSEEEGIIYFNVGGRVFATATSTMKYDKESLFYLWSKENYASLHCDDKGFYFIDRDPKSFGIVLNYLRLRKSGQLWEACLPKDPDRLALLTQEAEYYKLFQLRDQAIALLQNCTEKADMSYVNEVLAKSFSCPHGFELRDTRPTNHA
ncbi:hypothetical protein AB6A40_001880 [Gnathostoma spinigerum]|uniref:Potassium channel tetramerisation-type BTB domain-containing protein n=1 Tax=Gnathostoma spinigerum TaxID=75299 RepID=A0ABD6E6H4_9BILA